MKSGKKKEPDSLTTKLQNDEILYKSFQAVGAHIKSGDFEFVDGFLMATHLYDSDNAELLMNMIHKFREEIHEDSNLEELYVKFYNRLSDLTKML